jgi:hypothetical protein
MRDALSGQLGRSLLNGQRTVGSSPVASISLMADQDSEPGREPGAAGAPIDQDALRCSFCGKTYAEVEEWYAGQRRRSRSATNALNSAARSSPRRAAAPPELPRFCRAWRSARRVAACNALRTVGRALDGPARRRGLRPAAVGGARTSFGDNGQCGHQGAYPQGHARGSARVVPSRDQQRCA